VVLTLCAARVLLATRPAGGQLSPTTRNALVVATDAGESWKRIEVPAAFNPTPYYMSEFDTSSGPTDEVNLQSSVTFAGTTGAALRIARREHQDGNLLSAFA
jgi:hypothetical protein